MKEKTSKGKAPVIIAVVGVLATTFLISSVIKNSDSKTAPETSHSVSAQRTPQDTMDSIIRKLKVTEMNKIKGTVDYSDNLSANLPDIETKYPLTVKGGGDVDIEIFSTSEKAGKNNNGWLNETAESFNKGRYKLSDGSVVSVSVRSIPSGAASDYIANNVYIPQAYTPSNTLFGELAMQKGAKLTLEEEQLVGNTAGIALAKSAKTSTDSKYGQTNFSTVVDSVINGEIQLGYTYPYTSATGLNFLVNALTYFDGSDMMSSTSVEKFRQLQENIPFVCYTTDQMVNAMQSGTLQAGVVEYQAYVNNAQLKSSYEFIPFGYKHSNPLYSVGELDKKQHEALDTFLDFAMNDENQKHAEEYGFNKDINFAYNGEKISGNDIVSAQTLWKQEKNSGTPTIALFIADVSGSMNGDPIMRLKTSLLEASKNINSDNYIGLISYSDDIMINLPIGQFDLEQRSYFAGAVENLSSGGNTATYDALMQGIKMINDMKEQVPEANTMIFLLSDGLCNRGVEYQTAAKIVRYYGIPIYTIGYNEQIDSLKDLSSINEAVYIDADNNDVVYELSALFNAQM
ncbi:MAG: VWA domain-containing protein [Ruminococcus sp.]|nr:VWA domain-containing protein [Ruminococcus sp.]